ncbi:hypothetical protein [Glycomyces arizonensis]|uniref:hypothetical protein n=1 Tax=Glycomyces arizonensis TaxID=256035 RepID=UPI0012EB9E83|nr:hypothetical protein [Glycomyces arizonensis]
MMKNEPVIVGIEWRKPIEVRLFAQVVLDAAAKRLAEEREAEVRDSHSAIIEPEPTDGPLGSVS